MKKHDLSIDALHHAQVVSKDTRNISTIVKEKIGNLYLCIDTKYDKVLYLTSLKGALIGFHGTLDQEYCEGIHFVKARPDQIVLFSASYVESEHHLLLWEFYSQDKYLFSKTTHSLIPYKVGVDLDLDDK